MPRHRLNANGLTAKQQRFVEEYLVDLNGTAAARRAGYSAKSAKGSAAELLRDFPAVIAAVDRGLAERAKRTELTADWVLDQLKTNHELARAHQDFGASNKALELLGKHAGMWRDEGPKLAIFNLQINL